MPQCTLHTNSLSMLKYIIELSLYSEFCFIIYYFKQICNIYLYANFCWIWEVVYYMHQFSVMAMGFMWNEITSKTTLYIKFFFYLAITISIHKSHKFIQSLIRHTRIQVGKYLPDHCLTDNKKGVTKDWYWQVCISWMGLWEASSWIVK